MAIVLGTVAAPYVRATGYAPIWFPAASAAAMSMRPRSRWPIWLTVGLFTTTFVLVRQAHPPLPNVALRVLLDLALVTTVAYVIPKYVSFPMTRIRHALALIVIALGAGSARFIIGVLAQVVSPPEELSQSLVPSSLGLSGAAGALTLIPLVILGAQRSSWAWTSMRSGITSTVTFVALIAVTCLIFLTPSAPSQLGLSFILIPMLMLLAARREQFPLALTLSVTSFIIVYGATAGLGPFQRQGPNSIQAATLDALLFLVAVPATAWLLTSALAESRQSAQTLAQAEEVARAQADTDAATGLRSRLWISQYLDRACRATADGPTGAAAMFADLSEFELIRSSLGFESADALLREISNDVRDSVGDRAEVGRFDGDRLALVVAAPTTTSELSALSQSVLSAVRRERDIGGNRVSREGFVGVAVASEASTPESLLRNADLALSTARAQRMPGWKVFDIGDDTSSGSLALETDIRRGLDNLEFVPYYQPQVLLRDGTTIGYEALVRWRHPERGVLAPGEFLPEAERTGLISALGEQVFEQVCARLSDNPDMPSVSFNLSATELNDPLWAAILAGIADAHGVKPGRIVIELTETAVFRLTDDSRRAILRLADAGMALHVDDFGTGYSSVAHLRDLPVSGLKLDRSFVNALTEGGPRALALVTGLAGLANGLGLLTVAEGVETQEQASALREAGWIAAQGYLYGRPAPVPTPGLPEVTR